MNSRAGLLLAAITIASLLGGVAVRMFKEARASERQIQQLAFERQFRQRLGLLEERLNLDASRLRALSALFAASERVTPEEFRTFAEACVDGGDHVAQVAYAAVDGDQIRLLHSFPEHRETELAELTRLEDFRTALEAAREQGGVQTTAVVSLEPFGIRGRGMVSAAPVIRGSGSEREPVGYALLVYELNRLMLRALVTPDLPAGLRLTLTDVPAYGEPYEIFAQPGDPLEVVSYAQAHSISLGGRNWHLALQGDGSLAAGSPWTSWVLLVFGISASLAVATLWVSAVKLRQRVKRQVRSHREDIERNRLELEQTLTALKQANDDLILADRNKTEFLSTVSHELRTPLTVIQEYVDLILSGRAPTIEGEAREFLEVTKHQLSRLKRLVGDLLDFARLESNSLAIRRSFVRPEDVLARLREFFVPIARGRGLMLQFSFEGGLPPLWADPDRLEQVLGNLVSNALKFTPRGRGVRIHASTSNTGVVFLVEDDGPGMKPEESAVVFKRFQRLSNANAVDGTGLGLAIAQGLIELLGGTIDLNTSPGHGSCFRVELPAYTQEEVIENEIRSLTRTNPDAGRVQVLRGMVPSERVEELDDWLRSTLRERGTTAVLNLGGDSIILLAVGEESLMESVQVNSRAVFPMIRWDDESELLHAA